MRVSKCFELKARSIAFPRLLIPVDRLCFDRHKIDYIEKSRRVSQHSSEYGAFVWRSGSPSPERESRAPIVITPDEFGNAIQLETAGLAV
jgi:hypothetical protein